MEDFDHGTDSPVRAPVTASRLPVHDHCLQQHAQDEGGAVHPPPHRRTGCVRIAGDQRGDEIRGLGCAGIVAHHLDVLDVLGEHVAQRGHDASVELGEQLVACHGQEVLVQLGVGTRVAAISRSDRAKVPSPWRTSNRPVCASTRTASRIVERPTPNSRASSPSAGNRWSNAQVPSSIRARRATITRSVRLPRSTGTALLRDKLIWRIEGLRDTFHHAVFVRPDLDAALQVCTPDAELTHLPMGTGTSERRDLRAFLADDVLEHLPSDLAFRRISRSVDHRRLTQESLVTFTHDRELPWLLPGLPPTAPSTCSPSPPCGCVTDPGWASRPH